MSERDRERFREEILSTARRLFVEAGFQAVSMRRIASEVGCSPMKLYTYFAGKRELLRRIWEDSLGRVLSGLRPVLEANGPAVQRLRNFGIGYVQYWLDHPDEYRVVFMNEDAIADSDDEFYVHASDMLERLTWVQAVIDEGVTSGELAVDDSNLCVQQLMCVLGGLAHNLVTIPEFPWEPPDRLIHSTVDAFMRGLLADSTRTPRE